MRGRWRTTPRGSTPAPPSRATDTAVRRLLGDLAAAEAAHETTAGAIEARHLPGDVRLREDDDARRRFILQIVQPGLVGLMDGSVSTLAPVFAAAFATHSTWSTFLVGWRPRSAPASRWASPRRWPMTASCPAAARPTCAGWCAG